MVLQALVLHRRQHVALDILAKLQEHVLRIIRALALFSPTDRPRCLVICCRHSFSATKVRTQRHIMQQRARSSEQDAGQKKKGTCEGCECAHSLPGPATIASYCEYG